MPTPKTPKLKSTTKAITHIEWHDMCAFLEALFGVEEFVWNDCANGRYQRVQIATGDLFFEHDRKKYERAKKKGYIEEYELRTLFLGLMADGHLPPGDYLVHNSW